MVESKHKWKAWLYLSPAIILLLIFTVWPIINTVYMAFSEKYSMMEAFTGKQFTIGFGNFEHVLVKSVGTVGSDFFRALGNTAILCVITVPLSTILALLIAVCLNSIKPLQKLLQTIFFLPYVTNSIAIGMVFAAMFQVIGMAPDGSEAISWGLINEFLKVFGVDSIDWLGSTDGDYWANITVMVVYIVWNALPFKILVLLGGLQGINKQYYEAARVDSTSKFRVFRKITVPLLSPMISYVVITSFIGGFKEYSSIVGVFGEDMNGGRLNTMVGYIYTNIEKKQGYASAAALVLFVIIFIVTMINLYVSKKKTHY
ncbi:MAG: sugar ABC transporter permease [Clostridia bacterium]|nr:sugar ABC transporter permease [Clostridia bacterium]